MKKTLLSVGILLSTLSMVMGQRYINFNGSTAAGFTVVYPLVDVVTSTTCGYFGGDAVSNAGSQFAPKYFNAGYDSKGVQITNVPGKNASDYKGIYVGITNTNPDCQSVQSAAVNLYSGNTNVYVSAVNNGSLATNLTIIIGDAAVGSTNTNSQATPNLSANAAAYSLDYANKFSCTYSCTTSPGNNAPGPLVNPVTVDQGAINQFFITPNGGGSIQGLDFTILALGVGYQTLLVNGTLSTFATTGAVQTVTLTGGILTSDVTVTAPTNFSVSANGTTYGTTATFSPVAGLLNPSKLYVKYTGTGTSQGNITLAATSILTQKLLASGAVVTDYNSESISQALVVSPNPTNQGYVDVTSSLNISNITVVNAQGAQVNASVNANRVNTSSLTPGVYTLLIDTEKGRTAKKIIVE